MSASVVHSNAFNFRSFLQHGVDPRTGQYTVSLSIPELRNNHLAGPAFPLAMAFNPLNTRDAGYGVGWAINLTEFNPKSRLLALGTGETFTANDDGQEPGLDEKKLGTFRFLDDGGGRYRVLHRSGLVEVLRTGGSSNTPLALPEQVVGPDGRSMSLTYVNFAGDRRLYSVADPEGELLRVERNDIAQEVALLFYPGRGVDGQPLARYVMHLDGHERVVRVVLPTEDEACWRFAYTPVGDLHCLSEIWTPTGAHETLEYDGGHAFPGGELTPLPRVHRHTVDPHADQPCLEVEYTYSNRNFLGNGALTSWSNDGFDNLYRVTDHTFDYYSIAALRVGDEAVRQVRRTYNRFHLMTEETTTQGNCVKRTTTRYYADHPDNINKEFALQPPQCQLPMTVETSWELIDDATQRQVDICETRFDAWGNLTEQRNADGTREVFDYHPLEGSTDCPPDPQRFVRNLKSRTVHPSPAGHGDAPVLRTAFGYAALPGLPWDHEAPCLVESWQTLSVVDPASLAVIEELRRRDTTCFDDPGDALRHGRTRRVEQTIHEKRSVTEYDYQIATPARIALPTLQVTETLTGFDTTTQTVIQHHTLYAGQAALETGLDGVERLRIYDALNRVVSETIAPGTEYAATQTYEHHLVGGSMTGTAWQLTTDANGAVARSQFDGLARLVSATRWDPEATDTTGDAVRAGAFRPTYQATYNALDQIVTEVQYDWFGEEDRAFVRHNRFDDWGELCSTVRPDGVTEVTRKSPFGKRGPVEHRWLEAPGKPARRSSYQVIEYNRFGSADSVLHLDDQDEVAYALTQSYDGLGQCVQSHEQFGTQERTTGYVFDAWRRMERMTLPDDTIIRRRFADHSGDDLAVEMLVQPSNAALPEISIGTRTFDGLDRVATRVVGGRQERYGYAGGHTQPCTHTTAAGHTITIDYERALGDAPHTVTGQDETATYVYDAISGAVVGAGNAQGERVYAYTATGELASERFIPPQGTGPSTDYVTSLRGLVRERKDSGLPGPVDTLTTTYRHDNAGRLEYTCLGLLSATVEYDAFSRPWRTTHQNLGTGQVLAGERTYDAMGRETGRVLVVGSRRFTVTHAWRGDDQLEGRTLSLDGVTLLDETFHYDRRGRLQRHVCSGSQLPQDRHGNRIVHQVFTYDALSNVTRCITEFDDDSEDRAEYSFYTDDPCQLKEITHSHSSYAEPETFTYDLDGNLLNDHQGSTLRYDSLGRLLSLAQGSDETRYFYDGHGELLGTARGSGSMTLRQHVGYQNHHQIGEDTSYALYANGELVGVGSTAAAGSARLLLTNAIGSVIGQIREAAVDTLAYSAYGESDTAVAELLGFNGETREPGDWYLLGRGYRAYSPALQRFNRPDSRCPFGGGGLNAYAYCDGNPVRFRDPTGHVREAPDYYYPPPPPPPPPEPAPPPKQGGGWLKWLGVAISSVFLAVSIVVAPWSLGITAPLMIKSLVGIAVQVAGIGLAVWGNLTTDPGLQVATMIGSMVLGMVGSHIMSAAAAKAAARSGSMVGAQKQANALATGPSTSSLGSFEPTLGAPATPGAKAVGAAPQGSPTANEMRAAPPVFNRLEVTSAKPPRFDKGPVLGTFSLARNADNLWNAQAADSFQLGRSGMRQSPGLNGYVHASFA